MREWSKLVPCDIAHVFMHREELKQAILNHELWSITSISNPPVFDLYVSDFIANNKKTKMLFVSAEKSKQEEIVNLFKSIYDGSLKEYPNGSMMLFIPLQENAHTSPNYCSKILFNHDKFHVKEAVVCIGGWNNLKTMVTLRNGRAVSIQSLLKGFPASPGMSCSVLLETIEAELKQVIAEGEEAKLF